MTTTQPFGTGYPLAFRDVVQTTFLNKGEREKQRGDWTTEGPGQCGTIPDLCNTKTCELDEYEVGGHFIVQHAR